MPRKSNRPPPGRQRIASWLGNAADQGTALDGLWQAVLSGRLQVWAAIVPAKGSLVPSTEHSTFLDEQGVLVAGDLVPRSQESWLFDLHLLSDKAPLLEGELSTQWDALQLLTLQDHGPQWVGYFKDLYVSPAQARAALQGRAVHRRKPHDDKAVVVAAWDAWVARQPAGSNPFADENLAETRKQLLDESEEVSRAGAEQVRVGGKVQTKASDRAVRYWLTEYLRGKGVPS